MTRYRPAICWCAGEPARLGGRDPDELAGARSRSGHAAARRAVVSGRPPRRVSARMRAWPHHRLRTGARPHRNPRAADAASAVRAVAAARRALRDRPTPTSSRPRCAKPPRSRASTTFESTGHWRRCTSTPSPARWACPPVTSTCSSSRTPRRTPKSRAATNLWICGGGRWTPCRTTATSASRSWSTPRAAGDFGALTVA